MAGRPHEVSRPTVSVDFFSGSEGGLWGVMRDG